jgi:hypothetical protein
MTKLTISSISITHIPQTHTFPNISTMMQGSNSP